ncbi:MAG: phospho-sugar mutase [Clostridia bacterium]|nr:phospho-sugar mutase [Clostridia bacterium]
MDSSKFLSNYKLWLGDDYFSEFHDELASISSDPAEIRERFYKELDFGTAGIRGIMGAGLNRLNVMIVRKVSTAIARFIRGKGTGAMHRGVVVGYDSRINSERFAKEAASVLAGHGITTYIHSSLSPVPLLSYSVRELNCEMGVMITASHNPKEYNGYKVYGPDGAQLSPDDSELITLKMKRIADLRKLRSFDFEELISKGEIKYCPDIIVGSYMKTVRALLPDNSPAESHTEDLKVVYTPLHGAGAAFVPEILKSIGVGTVKTVKKQMIPDGNFPTVPVPNPENSDVYKLALKEAARIDADIIIATDPDSDRTGACVKTEDGRYRLLTGNEIGEILLMRRISLNKSKNPFVVSTLVSTRIASKICKAEKVKYIDVLTGFKFIGEQIKIHEENGDGKFIFGFEESYGYLAGSYCRDKDAVASCMLICEAAAYYKSRGMTIASGLSEIYEKTGAQHEIQTSLVLSGESGAAEMKRLMSAVRLAGADILTEQRPDYYMDLLENKKFVKTASGKYRVSAEKDFPISDVLYYSYDGFWFCLRPSGTEPKIKVYFGAEGASEAEAVNNADELKKRVMARINAL